MNILRIALITGITDILTAGIIATAAVIFVMLAWNATLPELFGFKEISLWMAWKVGFLCITLFKSSASNGSN